MQQHLVFHPHVRQQLATLATPLTYRVYGTREGLVGGTTANGHIIKSYDRFVALRKPMDGPATWPHQLPVASAVDWL